jgi:polyketide synthase 12/myxalamid-type polyketide synthase MxaB
VGLAAVQLARLAGAEVHATASPAKRGLLRGLGVAWVGSTRGPGFGATLRRRLAAGGSAGLEVVLNSLTGELVAEGIDLLAPGGRFIEIGKPDPAALAAAAGRRPDIVHETFDLLDLARQNPGAIRALLAEILGEMAAGRLLPPPCRVHPLAEAATAFRRMAQGRHAGKLLLVPAAGPPGAPRAARRAGEIRADATHLITGGLGGLGLLLARRLAARGARHLVLAGRAAPSPAAAATVAELRAAGVAVETATADVSRPGDVDRLLADIAARLPPLAGIFHAAGVLDDGVLLQQDWHRFAPVLAPKLAGAWNLHHRTRHLALDHFVLFSSLASLLGSPGQGNHAAANAFLDGLAWTRHRQGLPALSVQWGAWEEAGAAAATDLQQRMAARGLGAMAPERALDVLEELLAAGTVEAAVTPIDWPRFLDQLAPAAPPFFAAFRAAGAAESLPVSAAQRRTGPPALGPSADGTDLPRRLAALPAGERRRHLTAFVREQVARVLGLADPAAVDARQPLMDLGLDSLLSVELRNRLRQALGQPLPATLVFKHPTLEALAGHLATAVLHLEEPEPAATAAPHAAAAVAGEPPPEDTDLAAIRQLSDDEVRRLLAGEISEMDALAP